MLALSAHLHTDASGSDRSVDQQGSGSTEPSPNTCASAPHAGAISEALMMDLDHKHARLPTRPNLAKHFRDFKCGK